MKKLLLIGAILIASQCFYAQNWGFESWTNINVLDLDDYYTSIGDWGILAENAVVRSTDSYTNTYSVRLETIEITSGDTIFGYFMNGDPETYDGGQKLTTISTMDSIVGYYKYDIPAGDTALLICLPKFLGTPTGGNMVKIIGSQTTWTRFSYPVNSVSCDTVILAAASSNAFLWQGAPGSYLMLDDIKFVSNATGTESAINGDFENWSNIGYEEPDDWATSNLYALNSPTLPAESSTDAYTGTYAAQLTTILIPTYGDTVSGLITNGEWSNNGAIGGMPYSNDADGIEFYYKYNPFGTDTAWFSTLFKYNGSYIDMYGTQIFAASSYTLWSSAISLPTTPDTVLIAIGSGENPGSVLLIDDINITHPVAISENYSIHELIAFPVPATDKIYFKFNLKESTDINIQIINSAGILISESRSTKSEGEHRECIELSNIPAGNYIYKISIGKESYSKNFIKK